ncbi:MAG: diphosphomevalonate decarboxylase, partial [Flavobacteriaceae bacterium]
DRGKKQVSSSVGHQLMQGHPFAVNRFDQAHKNCELLKSVLKTGDIEQFIEITESEALSLHSMMMTSRPRYILMQPNTLSIINKVWEYRVQTKIPISFTLDAGANVHLLYPVNESDKVITFIKSNLLDYCQSGQFIQDQVGEGAKKM